MNRVQVYYDGLCQLCSREINHYRNMRGAENLEMIDITGPEFKAEKEGLNPHEVHRSLHVRDREGRVHTGVGAFLCIWQELPAMKPLRTFVAWPILRPFFDRLYAGFARVRPLLPRKACESSPYCEVNHHAQSK